MTYNPLFLLSVFPLVYEYSPSFSLSSSSWAGVGPHQKPLPLYLLNPQYRTQKSQTHHHQQQKPNPFHSTPHHFTIHSPNLVDISIQSSYRKADIPSLQQRGKGKREKGRREDGRVRKVRVRAWIEIREW